MEFFTIVCLLIATPFAIATGFLAFLYVQAKKIGTYPAVQADASKVIVISGCDTGFGHDPALRLAESGFHVVAGVLQEASIEGLETAAAPMRGEISAVVLDICKSDQIQHLGEFVRSLCEREGKTCVGLVNNAGIAVPGPLEYVTPEKLKFQLQVNTFGHHEVTVALLPLLRKSKGRIVNLISIAGRVAGPGMGPYSMSKFAMEAFTDTLRHEMYDHGISVSGIEPGFARTNIITGITAEKMQALWDGFGDEAKSLYPQQYDRISTRMKKVVDGSMDPKFVVDDIVHGLTSPNPCAKYLTGRQAKFLAIASLLPTRMFDVLIRFTLKRA